MHAPHRHASNCFIQENQRPFHSASLHHRHPWLWEKHFSVPSKRHSYPTMTHLSKGIPLEHKHWQPKTDNSDKSQRHSRKASRKLTKSLVVLCIWIASWTCPGTCLPEPATLSLQKPVLCEVAWICKAGARSSRSEKNIPCETESNKTVYSKPCKALEEVAGKPRQPSGHGTIPYKYLHLPESDLIVAHGKTDGPCTWAV